MVTVHSPDTDSSELPVEKGEEEENACIRFYRYVLGSGYKRNVGGTERTTQYSLGGLSVFAGLGIVAFPVLVSALANHLFALVLIARRAEPDRQGQVQYCPLKHSIGRSTYSEKYYSPRLIEYSWIADC